MILNYDYLGEAVNGVFKEYGFTAVFLNGQFSSLMKFENPSGFRSYIRDVRKGDIFGQPNKPDDLEKCKGDWKYYFMVLIFIKIKN